MHRLRSFTSWLNRNRDGSLSSGGRPVGARTIPSAYMQPNTQNPANLGWGPVVQAFDVAGITNTAGRRVLPGLSEGRALRPHTGLGLCKADKSCVSIMGNRGISESTCPARQRREQEQGEP